MLVLCSLVRKANLLRRAGYGNPFGPLNCRRQTEALPQPAVRWYSIAKPRIDHRGRRLHDQVRVYNTLPDVSSFQQILIGVAPSGSGGIRPQVRRLDVLCTTDVERGFVTASIVGHS
jgi:hypothetical protein